MTYEESAFIQYAGRTYKIVYHFNINSYWIYYRRTWMEDQKLVAKFDTLKECLKYIESNL